MNSEILKAFHIRTRLKQFFHNRGIKIRIPKHQKFLNNNFYLHGNIKADYDTGWSIELSRNAEIIFDVGCNIGINAILFNQFSSMKRIYLFEPNPNALSLAVENSILNGFSKKVRIFNYCISNKNNEIMKFYSVLEGAAGSLHKDFSPTANDLNNSYNVKTKTIDKICKDDNVIPDFVKIDVEGHEYQVLEGAKKTALNGKTKFLVEMHSSNLLSMEENAERVINLANIINHKVLYLAKMQYINNPEAIKKRGRCHLLLVPEDFTINNRLKSIKQGETNFHIT
ncbi:MAG: FkbM family methyltransferase [Candidatus Neomarinimicrobiota bacterium]